MKLYDGVTDRDTRAGGVDGCVQAASNKPCRPTDMLRGHASMALFADRHGKSVMLRAGRYHYCALHVML